MSTGALFVGRGDDLAWLSECAARRDCRAVVIGEAGAGKTSLIQRVAASLPVERTFSGGALASLRWEPYLALRQAMHRRLPRQADVWSGDAEFVADAVEKSVGDGLIVLDDVHWADAGTWSVVPLLAGRVRIIAAVRLGDPASDDALSRLADLDFERRTIAPLEPADARVIARHVRGDLADFEVESIVARAGGNPLVVEELAAGNVASLRLAMAARLASLSSAAVGDLELVAVAGQGLDVAALTAAVELLRAGVLIAQGSVVSIRHAMLAEVIVDEMTDERRRDVHRRLAAIVTDPGAKARHLQQAGDRPQAYLQAMIAVDAALTPGERAAHLVTAAACASRAQEPRLLVRAARAAADAGEFTDAAGLLDRIVDPGLDVALMRAHLASETGDGEGWLAELERARLALDGQTQRGNGAASTVRNEDRVTLLAEEARATLLAAGDPLRATEQARLAAAEADRLGLRQGLAHYVLGTALYYLADVQSAVELEIALTHARSERDLLIEMRAANNRIVVLEGHGDFVEGRTFAEQMAQRASELKLLRWQRHFLASAMNIALHAGDFVEIITRARELLESPLISRTREQMASTYALALMHVGRIDESLRVAEKELAASSSFGSNRLALQAIAASYRGDDDAVVRTWEPFLAAAENEHRVAFAAPIFVRAARAVTLRGSGRIGDAAAGAGLVRDGGPAAHLAPVTMPGAELLPVDLLPGLPDLDELKRMCEIPMIRGVPAEVEAIRCEVADPARAAQLYGQAIELYRARECESELRCRWLRGVALTAAGDRDAAIAELTAAEREAADRHMAPLLAQIQRSLRDLGVRRATRRIDGVLTSRQAEILELVVHGLTDADIAARLGISVRTVQTHIAAARRSLGAGNRRQAALLAAEMRGS